MVYRVEGKSLVSQVSHSSHILDCKPSLGLRQFKDFNLIFRQHFLRFVPRKVGKVCQNKGNVFTNAKVENVFNVLPFQLTGG